MKIVRRILLTFIICLLGCIEMQAQIKGIVVDAETGDSLSFVNIYYTKRPDVGTWTKNNGLFSLRLLEGHNLLTISYVGYKTTFVTVDPKIHFYTIRLYPDNHELKDVVVRPKHMRYSRKNNPAVELMKKVIAAKKNNDLRKYDYFSYDRYRKQTFSLNDISKEKLDTGIYKKFQFMRNQVELCPQTGKMILPIAVNEEISTKIYRKRPESEKTIIEGTKATGLNQMFATGDILTTGLKDVFTDVNIYDDHVRLFQYPFLSPVASSGAISFYRYFIMDTTYVEKDKCIHLSFVPNNPQDFGFTGHIYIKADSSYQIKKCILNLPIKSGVNWVTGMTVLQEFEVLPSGENVLANDDVITELSLYGLKFQIRKLTKYNDFSFEKIPDKKFQFEGKERVDRYALMRDDAFWQQHRAEALSASEQSTESFFNNLSQIKLVKYLVFGIKAIQEKYIETGSKKTPSKLDIGPIPSIISTNFVEGVRLKGGAQTTANLNPHLFFRGYYAYGFKDHRSKGLAEVQYSFNKKKYASIEYPTNAFTLNFKYDVQSPTDKFSTKDADNVFTSWKFTTVDQMMYSRIGLLKYEKEWLTGWRLTGQIKVQNDEPCGRLEYRPLIDKATLIHDINYTELMLGIRFAPGELVVNTKQHRHMVNFDVPVFSLTHQMGLKGFLGGEYRYNETEFYFFKRLWMPQSWGKIDTRIRAGAQWNKVPFPLLIVPAANLSYLSQAELFNLVNNMEFLNDRYASLNLLWDLNGKIFNRIPLLKKLNWRESLGVKVLWGKLTDKNNPYKHANDSQLFMFPSYDKDGNEPRSFIMGRKPYIEVMAGIHNIFKILHVEYVRRLTYLNLPTATKWGIRVRFELIF